MKKNKVKSDIDKQLEKEIKNMSLERRELLLEIVEIYKKSGVDGLRRLLRYTIYFKNVRSANRRNIENLNLGFFKEDSGNSAS